MQLELVVPVMLSCALLWWIGRSLSWTARLAVTAVTLVIVVCVLLFERVS